MRGFKFTGGTIPIFGVFHFHLFCGNISVHICIISTKEVKVIRKATIYILILGMLFAGSVTHMKASAAEVSSYVGAVTTQGGSLYVRKAPELGSTILTSLKKGSYVTLMEKSGNWWKVEYAQNRFGYCYASYITPVEGTAAAVDTDGDILNVRTGPGTGYSRITALPHGTIVMVRSTENGWSRILYHGTKMGYVSAKYLSGVVEKPNTTYSAISLNVPSFKQTDSRWASYPLGTRGGTIGTIGCAVTGISMLESYRTGTTIYPNEMAKKLSFTAGGAVYWPSHFKGSTTQSGYLQKIYNLLQEGKPVLIGATTSSGGQHWVVITGYSGGNTLSTSGFTINDPGSNTRSTLQQFLRSYPIFYKYFHY